MKNLKSIRTILLLSILTLCFAQCQVRPSAVLDRERMKAVTRDMLLTDAYLMERNLSDSAAALYYESVLAKHNVPRAKYDSSLVWYGENSPILTSIYDELLSEFRASVALLDSAYVDSMSMFLVRYVAPTSEWVGNSRVIVHPAQKYVSWRVSLPSASYVNGDTIDLSFRLVPGLRAEEKLIGRLFVLDSMRYHVLTIVDSIGSLYSGNGRMQFVLPSALPAQKTLEFQLVYINRSSAARVPLLLDSITIGKRVPPPIPSAPADELSPEIPAIETSTPDSNVN